MNQRKARVKREMADDDLMSAKDKERSRGKQDKHKAWDEIEEEWGDWSDGEFDDRDW